MKWLERYGRLAALSIVAAVPFWSAAAWAHTGSGEAGGFLTGVRHPVSGLDHVLAMIAVGLWGAQLGNPAVWLLPVAFPMMMAFGGMFGLLGLPLPGVEMGIAVSAVVLGVMVLGRRDRRYGSPWRSSPFLQSSTATPTARSCPRVRAGCSTAWGS
jgi:hydrogenase/urease accessory protein HupE